MDIFEVLEDESLESHASVREKRQRQATRLLFVQKKFRSGVDQLPKFGRVEAMSVGVTNYVSKPAIFVQSCPCFG
jgi:hypothetical protein